MFFLGTLEFHGEFYETGFITQFKIEFLPPFIVCIKVLGKMPGKWLRQENSMLISVSFSYVR